MCPRNRALLGVAGGENDRKCKRSVRNEGVESVGSVGCHMYSSLLHTADWSSPVRIGTPVLIA